MWISHTECLEKYTPIFSVGILLKFELNSLFPDTLYKKMFKLFNIHHHHPSTYV